MWPPEQLAGVSRPTRHCLRWSRSAQSERGAGRRPHAGRELPRQRPRQLTAHRGRYLSGLLLSRAGSASGRPRSGPRVSFVIAPRPLEPRLSDTAFEFQL